MGCPWVWRVPGTQSVPRAAQRVPSPTDGLGMGGPQCIGPGGPWHRVPNTGFTEAPQLGTCLPCVVPSARVTPWCPQHEGCPAQGTLGRLQAGGGVPGLTQDVDVAPGDAVETGADGALVAHVQLLDLQRPAQRRPRRCRQRPAPAHVPHGGNDWGGGCRGGSAPHGGHPLGTWGGGGKGCHLGSGAACPVPAGRPAPARCQRSSR